MSGMLKLLQLLASGRKLLFEYSLLFQRITHRDQCGDSIRQVRKVRVSLGKLLDLLLHYRIFVANPFGAQFPDVAFDLATLVEQLCRMGVTPGQSMKDAG